MGKLNGKTAIVTGGASGIGAATVRHFVDEGAIVVITDIDPLAGSRFEAQLRSAGARVVFIEADVSNEDHVGNVMSTTREQFGGCDVLFNNAGIGLPGLGHTVTLPSWHRVMSVNLDGSFLMAKHAIISMLETGGGSIVNMSSIMGLVGVPDSLSYNVSKHGIVGMTKSLALEYAPHNVRVNAVCPGYIDTPMGRSDVEANPSIPRLHPLGRIGTPLEVAKAVSFLASDEASFITGTSLLVDGGYTAQ
ncbi:SDR family NAD(P)-dependent oxidoreductase [Rhodococcus sp. JVH1]|uniref:SDR family NAD(P)-dependent oxidoreductase n=1 Tax=Rhodococcus sp. JVH1 TaxID=745408 RepID=UPI0002721D27|nr:glucose 1-dehydrogenase [Rhodococcus sp. JVH1]EJI95813.1 2,5-dichloro-2,5-cyclohexadiene-1,4-diol dehydrogenase [Rhodococcus sp. JVH1]